MRLEDKELHKILAAAGMSRKQPIVHVLEEQAAFLWSYFDDWMQDVEANGIVQHVKNDDSVEAWRQLTVRFHNQSAFSMDMRLRAIRDWPADNKAKRNADVPGVLRNFERLLEEYFEGFKADALTTDLKKLAIISFIPTPLENTFKDMVLDKDMQEEQVTSVEIKEIINKRIMKDLDKDVVYKASGVGSYGRVGKGAGKQQGGGNPNGAGKHERLAGACWHCRGFGYNSYCCRVRLRPEAAEAARKERERESEERPGEGQR